MSEPEPGRRWSTRRLGLAFAIALLSDGLAIGLTPAPPLQWGADGATALLLLAVLGWQWALLPGLIMEAIPGVSLLPFWVLVVAATARYGSPRPGKGAKLRQAGDGEGRSRARADDEEPVRERT